MQGGESLYYGTRPSPAPFNIVTKGFSDKPEGQFTVAADTLNGRHLDGFVSDSIGRNHFVIYGSEDPVFGLSGLPHPGLSAERHRSGPRLRCHHPGRQVRLRFQRQRPLEYFVPAHRRRSGYAYPFGVSLDVNSRKEDLATTKLDVDFTDKISLYVKAYYHLW